MHIWIKQKWAAENSAVWFSIGNPPQWYAVYDISVEYLKEATEMHFGDAAAGLLQTVTIPLRQKMTYLFVNKR